MPAPIALFVFARPDHTRRTLAALAACAEAGETDLIVFCDGPRTADERPKVEETREIARGAKGFRRVILHERKENVGLARNIIEGVSAVVAEYGRIIVVEDDIRVSAGFLTFMNRALNHYELEPRVWHIAGWTYPISGLGEQESFLWRAMNCWGWGTWADRWIAFNKDPHRLIRSWTRKDIHRFNIDGAEPGFWQQVEMNARGEINTWAIFWYATIFERGGLCLNPTVTLVENIGLDGTGVHSPDLGEMPEILLNPKGRLTFPSEISEHAETVKLIGTHLRRPPQKLRRRIKQRLKRLIRARVR
ncbi:MAG: sugar transferase [Pseudomonadota bacterium]